MPRPLLVPQPLRSAPFRGTDAVAAGLLTRRQLDHGRWRRLFRDVYINAAATLDHRLWCDAAVLLMPHAVISGMSAAYLWGADVLSRDAPVEVTVPVPRRPTAPTGLVVVRSPLRGDDVVRLSGRAVTTPERTGFDLARRAGRVEAVVALDDLARRNIVQPVAIAGYAQMRADWPGTRRLSGVLRLVDGRAESPMESRVRLIIVDAGLPAPVSQFVVLDDDGVFVARVDLGYPRHRLGIEYEGDHHRSRATFRHDLRRLNRLRAAGWSMLRFCADDVFRHPGRIVEQVRAALGR